MTPAGAEPQTRHGLSMLSQQDLSEGAPYEHPDHGRVRVVLIDEAAHTVAFESVDQRLPNTHFRPMATDDIDHFRRDAEPLPITLDLPAGEASADTNLGGT